MTAFLWVLSVIAAVLLGWVLRAACERVEATAAPGEQALPRYRGCGLKVLP